MFDMFEEFTVWEIIKMVLGAIAIAPIMWAFTCIVILMFGGH